MSDVTKMDLSSLDIPAMNKHKLLECLSTSIPEVISEGHINFDQLRRVLGEWVDPGKERYGLNWPGKAECMRIIQQPSVAALKPQQELSVDFVESENVFIEGDNLEVLKLLQKSYFGKVKMIYIDPPYNTGNEFIYPDKYAETLETYLAYSGQIDSEGRKFTTNTDLSGRYHSNWLNMMYPRLYLAKNLLRDDGLIFVSIDDHEVDGLRQIMKEIFGEEQFISQIIVQSNKRGQTYKDISKTHEYILVFSKGDDFTMYELDKGDGALPFADAKGPYDLWELRNRNPKFGRHNRPNLFYPIYVSDEADEQGLLRVSLERSAKFCHEVLPKNSEGIDSCWRWGKETVISENSDPSSPTVVAKQRRDGHWNIYEKSRKSTTKAKSLWTETDVISEQGTVELGELGLTGIFDHPKPLGLVEKCLKIGSADDDIVLDFFAGSATTAHAVMKLNAEDGGQRRFILVQLPEPVGSGTAASKAGYKTIADIGRDRIKKAAQSITKTNSLFASKKEKGDLGFKSFALTKSNFRVWDAHADQGDVGEQIELHINHVVKDSDPDDILYELLLKAGFSLETVIERRQLAGKTVHSIGDGSLLICLENEITPELVDAIADANPLQVICLDEAFKANDQLKANAVQTFRSLSEAKESEIVFRTV